MMVLFPRYTKCIYVYICEEPWEKGPIVSKYCIFVSNKEVTLQCTYHSSKYQESEISNLTV